MHSLCQVQGTIRARGLEYDLKRFFSLRHDQHKSETEPNFLKLASEHLLNSSTE